MDSNAKLFRIFPYTDNITKLKIDDESIHYITLKEIADDITNIIIQNLKCNPCDVVITDATAGCGGNTFSFAKKFKSVNAIEINRLRYEYLCNNLKIYKLNNVDTYNDNCIDKLKFLKHDIIFIDPPWGGKNYKYVNKLKIYMENNTIENICVNLFNNKIMLHVPQAIVLKMPKNYDIDYFNDKVKNFKKIIELDKMLIVMIFR